MAVALWLTPAAEAHPGRWYWAQSLAEEKVLAKYYDVVYVDCPGYGRFVRKRGRKLYRHFDCEVELRDGSEDFFTLHVRGPHRFSISFS